MFALNLLLASAVTLRYQPPLNKPVRSTIVNRMSRVFPGQPNATMVQTVPLTTTAVSRAKDGTTTVRTTAGKVKVDVPEGAGMEKAKDEVVRLTSGKVSTIVVDHYSVPKSAVTPGVASTSSLGGFQGVVYPKTPVKVGDSWTYDLDASRMGVGANGSTVSGSVPLRYTLKNLATKGGRQVATLAMDVSGSLKLNAEGLATPLTMKGSGSLEVDVATGMVLSTRMSMETVVPMGGIGEMRQTVDLTVTSS